MINQAQGFRETVSDKKEMFALKMDFFVLLANAHVKFNFSPYIYSNGIRNSPIAVMQHIPEKLKNIVQVI